MSDRDWATLIGFAVFVGLRLLDYLLPKGRHLRFIERYTVRDEEPAKPEDEKG